LAASRAHPAAGYGREVTLMSSRWPARAAYASPAPSSRDSRSTSPRKAYRRVGRTNHAHCRAREGQVAVDLAQRDPRGRGVRSWSTKPMSQYVATTEIATSQTGGTPTVNGVNHFAASTTRSTPSHTPYAR
jgi:hypothetical protein